MEKKVAAMVQITVDDKEDCYCGACRFKNWSWCELFEENIKLDEHRLDYSPYGVPSSWKYFRCDKCIEAVRWNELFEQALEAKEMEWVSE